MNFCCCCFCCCWCWCWWQTRFSGQMAVTTSIEVLPTHHNLLMNDSSKDCHCIVPPSCPSLPFPPSGLLPSAHQSPSPPAAKLTRLGVLHHSLRIINGQMTCAFITTKFLIIIIIIIMISSRAVTHDSTGGTATKSIRP